MTPPDEGHPFDPSRLWADDVITPAEGLAFVRDLGFELVHGDRPDRPAGANLIVALREEPTRRHFDPERIDYWSSEHGRGVRRTVDRTSDEPTHPVAWGAVRLVDRLGVENVFFTLGGSIRVTDPDPRTRVAVLGSRAPVMRAGGHSQGKDVRADEVGAFFARLRAAVGSDVALEGRVLDAPPLVLYAALIVSEREALADHPPLGEARPGFAAWSQEELDRLKAEAPHDLAAGRALLGSLGIDLAG